jgi:hypothetical protein
MSNFDPGLVAFHEAPDHDTLFSVEPIWLQVMVEETLREVPAYFQVVTVARSHDRTFVLAAKCDEQTGAIQSYAHWMVCPVYGQSTVEKITQPNVYLHDGRYGFPTLTEAITSLNERTGQTI